LANSLNKVGIEKLWLSEEPELKRAEIKPCRYAHMLSMATRGEGEAVIDTSGINKAPGTKPEKGHALTGMAAFALWRGAYLTRQVSITNKILILMYWFKTAVFGRDISRF
jgi:NADH dehydrogenase FAD-containing subunit